MTVYWLMFLLAALPALSPKRLPPRQTWIPWALVTILLAFVIGLRHEVGGDWFTYVPNFYRVASLTFEEVAGLGDPGYYLTNWLAYRAGLGIYSVNLLCAWILMGGTTVFCRAQPRPWLALLAAVPYMLIVVGMGYTRQSAALGLALLGFVALGNGRVRWFVFWVLLGATFHKSAVLLIPIAALAASRNRLLTALLVVVATALAYYLLLADATDTMVARYIDSEVNSRGALIRVAMNTVPACLLLLMRKELVPDFRERRLWVWMAIFALLCIPAAFVYSTAIDRIALYLIPLQLYVFSRLPTLAHTVRGRTMVLLALVAYFAAVQFVWLNFANHAQYWVPYQFVPL